MPVQAPTGVNNLVVDNVYVFVIPPSPTAGVGIPTNLAAIVGTASWGPTNAPTAFSDAQSLYAAFGVAQYQDPCSLVVDGYLCAASNNNNLGVRVTDGSDLAATVAIKDSGGVNVGITLTAKYTGTTGGTINASFAAGNAANTFTMSIVRTGYPAEVYPNIPGGGSNAFWVAATNAINNGLQAVRPKSNLVTAVVGASAVLAPTTATLYPLVGGTDGCLASQVTMSGTTGSGPTVTVTINGNAVLYTQVAGDTTLTLVATHVAAQINSTGSVNTQFIATSNAAVVTVAPIVNLTYVITTSGTGGATPSVTQQPGANFSTAGSVNQIGTDGTTGRTGLYSLRGAMAGGQYILAGNTDTTVWGTQATFASVEGCMAIVCFPTGTSSSSAVTSKQTAGLASPYVLCMKDWINFYDYTNNVQRLVPPLGATLGMVAALPPEASPGNKPIGGMPNVISTERTGIPYSTAELGLLEANGIDLITNPIPRGLVFGLPHGENSSGILGQDTVAYTRMTNFIAYSLVNMLGGFVGELQGTAANDPTRNAARALLSNFFQQLQNQNRIAAFTVQMNTSNNTATSIGQGLLIANVQVTYMGIVRFFVVNLQGGQTVQVATGTGQVQ